MSRARDVLTYANVITTLALFLVLSGTAWAATTLKRDSVTSASIRDRSVTGSDVKNGTLTARDLAAGAVTSREAAKLSAKDLSPAVAALLAGGASGTSGAAGATGPAGSSGANGPSGTAGPGGATGATGSSGAPGASGAKGLLGAAGAIGPIGPAGLPGPRGGLGGDDVHRWNQDSQFALHVPPNGSASEKIECIYGPWRALSGGYEAEAPGVVVERSAPADIGSDGLPKAWEVAASNTTNVQQKVMLYVNCARLGA